MKAQERLYLTADSKVLVRDGDTRAASLYCSPGDIIPDDAAARFGLVDGLLSANFAVVGVEPDAEAILRVATIGGLTIGGLPFGSLIFTSEFQEIVSGQIDEAQLLAILEYPTLVVEAALVGDKPGWVEFPAREDAVAALKERVEADIAAGRPPARIELRPSVVALGESGDSMTIGEQGPPIDPIEAPRIVPAPASTPSKAPPAKPATAKAKAAPKKAGAKEQAPAEDKEQKGGANKEQAPGDKGAPAPASSSAGQGEAKA